MHSLWLLREQDKMYIWVPPLPSWMKLSWLLKIFRRDDLSKHS